MDVRTESARDHSEDAAGRVTGVHLTVHENKLFRYAANFVDVLGEDRSEGKTVAWVKLAGDAKPDGVKPALLIGYQGNDWAFIDGMVMKEFGDDLVITNKFEPPNLGPLAVALVDEQGAIVSDVVGSLGLPWGRHVCFDIVFHDREQIGEQEVINLSESADVKAEVAQVLADLSEAMERAEMIWQKYQGVFSE